MALPTGKAWPSKSEREALREHAWAHVFGWKHGEKPPSEPGRPLGLSQR